MHRGKKYRAAAEKVERTKLYPIDEALKFIVENKLTKFDESVEVHVRLSIDPKKGDEQSRGVVVLPHGTGKSKRVAVITSTKVKEATEAGAEVVGGEDLIEKIKNNKLEKVDVIVASPEMMPKIAPIAKILGPRGLMPNPKNETVTDKIKEAVENIKKGKVSFKNDATSIIHQVFGKASFDEAKLKENYTVLMEAVAKSKTAAVKGRFIESVTICTTMGPGLKIAL